MPLSNDPVFAQAPKTAGIDFAATTQSTSMDPSSVAPTTLLTAGTNGAIVTSVKCFAEGSATAEKFILWIQPGGTGSWYQVSQALMAAYTQAVTTAQGDTLLVDKDVETAVVRLSASDKLGVTHQVNQQSSVQAEYTDY